MDRLWRVRPPAPESHFSRFGHFPRPVAQLFFNRGLQTDSDVEAFLTRRVENDNPFHLHGMYEAVKRIRDAIGNGERIAVHGDFDADGVTSTALMVAGLHALGADVEDYIPHRVDEGYGLNKKALRQIREGGATLLVTVDCGIRAHEEIRLANQLGMDVIVTDHHTPGDLPPAHAIINPHQEACRYPHKMLAGVGLAWKMIQALWLAERKRPVGKVREELSVDELLDLVAIGTVADVAPLVGENRKLVWKGLEQLRRAKRPGVLALMESARITPEEANAEAIGFFLGPRINAAGRLAHADLAYKLLRERDYHRALQLAEQLEQKNRERQQLTREAMVRARTQIEDPAAPLLFVSDEKCPEGIVGLVAGRLQDRFYRPTIAVAQGPEWSRASCRSIPGFNITQALEQVADRLDRYGGHAAAAGFTARTEKLPEIEAALRAVAEDMFSQEPRLLRQRLVADAELPLHEIDEALVERLEELAPFGCENEEPLWMCRNIVVEDARQVGNGQNHLKLRLMDQQGRYWNAIAFRQGSRYDDLPPLVDLAYKVKRNTWNGRKRLELHLEDFQPARTQTES